MAELCGMLGLHNRQFILQLKFEVAETQLTVKKIGQQCWFLHSEARTSKFADQAPFTNPFYFIKEKIK